MWINTNTREVFYMLGAVREAFPNVSFPSAISDNDLLAVSVCPVRIAEKPEFNPLVQDLVALPPEMNDGEWVQKWQVVEKYSADGKAQVLAEAEAQRVENAKASIRSTRNAKLSATDWRFRSDMNPSQAWKDYCQALRDITAQPGFPFDVQWPAEPA